MDNHVEDSSMHVVVSILDDNDVQYESFESECSEDDDDVQYESFESEDSEEDEHVDENEEGSVLEHPNSDPSGFRARLDSRNSAVQRYDDTFENLTQGRRLAPIIPYAAGYGPPFRTEDDRFYGRERDVPLDIHECNCDTYETLVRQYPEIAGGYAATSTMYYRMRVLKTIQGNVQYDSMDHRMLVEQRQARSLAGLDTREMDREIARRILEDPGAFGWIGSVMQSKGYVWEVERDGDDYELR